MIFEGEAMTYKPDWADRLAAATTDLRDARSSWEYERPGNAWESMPWFVRWPLVVVLVAFFGGGLVAVFSL